MVRGPWGQPARYTEDFTRRVGGVFRDVEEGVFHAPFAAEAERDGVAFGGEVLRIEDPGVVGVAREGALDAGHRAGDVGFCDGVDLDWHCWKSSSLM